MIVDGNECDERICIIARRRGCFEALWLKKYAKKKKRWKMRFYLYRIKKTYTSICKKKQWGKFLSEKRRKVGVEKEKKTTDERVTLPTQEDCHNQRHLLSVARFI